MKIIFTQHVAGKGEKDQVKEISDGYARNFLIPKGLAVPATADRLKKIEENKKKHAMEDEGTAKRLAELARELNSRTIEFTLKGDDQGSVFGSVNKDAILKALRENGLTTHDRADVFLEHPLKEFGDHKVKVTLHKGIETILKVDIRKED